MFSYKVIMHPSLVERIKATKVWNAWKGRKGCLKDPLRLQLVYLSFFSLSLSFSQYDVINRSRIKCYFQIREVNVSYCVCMSLVSFLKWLLFVQVCCPTVECPNLFVFLTQCVHPGRHFILNRPAVVCILNEFWCKQRNVQFNFLHLFHLGIHVLHSTLVYIFCIYSTGVHVVGKL